MTNIMRQIKVLVVEDSLVFRQLLVSALRSDPAIDVVATANDPYEARDMIIKYRPDVMTLDVELPKMNGIEFLRKLMPQYPIRCVVISSLSDKVFDALSAGAVDFVAKPSTTDKTMLDQFLHTELPVKIKVASTAQIGPIKQMTPTLDPSNSIMRNKDLLLAIGASTGGTEAIAEVIRGFSTDIPGTLVVQHMPEGFTAMYAKRLNDQCRVHVKEAEQGDIVEPGHVYIAPGGNRQMRLSCTNHTYRIDLREGPKCNGHCPSVDVLFDSVAENAGKNALGIILTGMGGDGAKGLKKMRDLGCHTIGQDESTCVVYGMPKVAYELGAVEFQEKLSDISSKTYKILNRM